MSTRKAYNSTGLSTNFKQKTSTEKYPTMKVAIFYSALPLLLLFLGCEGCMEEEREALLQIKSSINSPEGTAFSGWYGQDCCQWEGIVCSVSNSRVVKLFFQYLRMADGTAVWYPNATVFAQFNDLEELYMPGNNIGGFISPSALQELKHLQRLDLRDNSITDGSHLCWGNMPALHSLDLSNNQLQGHIPKCLCQTLSFTDLNLSQNQLKGSIDACFSNMTSLQHFYLSNNQFTGKFPSLLIQKLTNIQSFSISHNQFKDTIHFSIFANLSKLTSLDISYNSDLEVETESPAWSPSLNLTQLKLGGCNLNRRSGRQIPSFLSTQQYLQALDLSYNSLVGNTPSWLLYLVSSELWIRRNNLSGIFSKTKMNKSSSLNILDISDNFLHGTFPEDIHLMFPSLHQLNASMNAFSGNLPQSFGEMKQLRSLDLSRNNLHGQIPLANMTGLEYLSLSSNYFEGEALPRNFSLPNLIGLYLDRNNLSGGIPDRLSRSPYLKILSIHNNKLSGELSSVLPVLPQLRILLLRGNRFEGKIPLQLCQMQHLQILDLSENDLSGHIPTCLDNVSALTEEAFRRWYDSEFYGWATVEFRTKGVLHTYNQRFLSYIHAIDISCNRLTGILPLQVTRLRALFSLNVSNNLLTGEIPATLKDLEQVESLDLSRNKLYGPLPQELSHLSFLEIFDVSFNNLSGPVPIEKQFATFDNSSYEGNPNLCGPPLARECGIELTHKSQGERSEKWDRENWGRLTIISTLISVIYLLFPIELVY